MKPLRLKSVLLEQFYLCIDYRSLGLLRILLGLLLIHSWFDRFQDREVFYSTQGVLPPSVVASFDPTFKLCFTDYLGSVQQIELFFYGGLICYIAFTLGYKTGFFHTLSYIFYASQTCKCSILKSGGQRALAVFLLWSLFLPVARRFSLDALKLKKPEHTLSPPALAAFGIVFQIALIYALSAFSKFGPTWLDGTAIYYTLERDAIIKPLGIFFRENLAFLYKPLDYGTLVVEWLAAPFILSPFFQPRLRHLIICGLVLLHLGIWLSINVCDFSLVMIASYAVLLGPQDWQILQHKFPGKIFGRKDDDQPALSDVSPRPLRARVANVLAAALLTLILIDAAYFAVGSTTKITPFARPKWIGYICYALSIGQDWRLFAPDPSMDDGWYVVVGFTESGKIIDPLTGKLPTPKKPDPGQGEMYKTCNWRKYAHYLHRGKLEGVARAFCQYLIRRSQKAEPADRLVGVKLYYINESTPPPGTPRPFATETELVFCEPPEAVERNYEPLDGTIDER